MHRKVPAKNTNSCFPMSLTLQTHTRKGRLCMHWIPQALGVSLSGFERRPWLCLGSIFPSLTNCLFVPNAGSCLYSFLRSVKNPLSAGGVPTRGDSPPHDHLAYKHAVSIYWMIISKYLNNDNPYISVYYVYDTVANTLNILTRLNVTTVPWGRSWRL